MALEVVCGMKVDEGEDPGPNNIDLRRSGLHHASDLDAGFYDEEDVARLGLCPDAIWFTISSKSM